MEFILAIVLSGVAPSSKNFAWACFKVADIFVLASVALALSVPVMKLGSATAERMPTMATTTNSSTRVKAFGVMAFGFFSPWIKRSVSFVLIELVIACGAPALFP